MFDIGSVYINELVSVHNGIAGVKVTKLVSVKDGKSGIVDSIIVGSDTNLEDSDSLGSPIGIIVPQSDGWAI